ncbi:MAG: hypothetical protein HOJ18_06965 [Rhodospirillaceae bacterium]|nr:hypothetical protein [Rhodospirillaceae bacterium]
MTIEHPRADKESISRFILAITCDWPNSPEQVGLFEIRCLGDKKTPKSKRFSLDTIDEAVDFAILMNVKEYNIYMMINPIRMDAKIKASKAATDPDILRAHYSFADADDQAGLTGIIKLSELCEPDIVVTTGTVPHERRHAYWRLSDACTDLELWRSTQFNIATQFATDSRVINPSRIMRVAGTVSYPNTDKQRRGYISELVTMKEKVNGCH